MTGSGGDLRTWRSLVLLVSALLGLKEGQGWVGWGGMEATPGSELGDLGSLNSSIEGVKADDRTREQASRLGCLSGSLLPGLVDIIVSEVTVNSSLQRPRGPGPLSPPSDSGVQTYSPSSLRPGNPGPQPPPSDLGSSSHRANVQALAPSIRGRGCGPSLSLPPTLSLLIAFYLLSSNAILFRK